MGLRLIKCHWLFSQLPFNEWLFSDLLLGDLLLGELRLSDLLKAGKGGPGTKARTETAIERRKGVERRVN